MRKISYLFLVALILSCATSLSPQQKADMAFTQGSIAYEAAQNIVRDARAKNLVNQADWDRFDTAQHIVAQNAPLVRDALNLWASTGVKPLNYDSLVKLVNDAFAIVLEIQGKVH